LSADLAIDQPEKRIPSRKGAKGAKKFSNFGRKTPSCFSLRSLRALRENAFQV
jgi:hypothetical protein